MKITASERKRVEERRQLLRALSRAPSKEISGIVVPSSPGAGRWNGERLYTFSFELSPWRVKGGTVEEQPMEILRPCGERAVDGLMEVFQKCTSITIRARVGADAAGTSYGLLVKPQTSPCRDKEILAHAKRAAAPIVHKDPSFGKLVFDRQAAWWEGKARWRSRPIRISFDAPTEEKLKEAARTAKALQRSATRWEDRVREFAQRKLLKLANAWLRQEEPDAEPITPAVFQRRIKITSLFIGSKGRFEFDLDDGDLFFGHGISVSGTLTKGPVRGGLGG